MKQLFAAILVLLLLAALAGCTAQLPAEESTAASTAPSEEILTGWQTIDGDTYCFAEDGTPLSGWRSDLPGSDGSRCYLDETGKVLTGWQDIDGKRYYFGETGAMTTGWFHEEGESYYFGVDGAMFTGLLNIQGKGYYFDQDGKRYTGWLEKDGNTYHFDTQGIMAVGPVEIDGQVHHFSPHGIKILLVNPWNPLPEDYEVELMNITERDRLETESAEAVQRMIADCEAAGHKIFIVSAYRTYEEQEYLFSRKVKYYTKMDWSLNAARKAAAKEVAPPGTSEHQLGLAIDLADDDYPHLDDHQAETPTQQWLMEHCHEYGFILRYPNGTTDITGIIFEPWHYRYVGVEIAQEIMNLGITLEEYLGVA